MKTLEAYFNIQEPLEVDFGAKVITFKLLNELSLKEIYSLLNKAQGETLNIKYFLMLLNEGDEESVKTLSMASYANIKQIYEEWKELSVVTLEEVAQLFATIEQYSIELQADLQNLTNIASIEELLELKPLTAVRVLQSILFKNTRKSHITTAIKKLERPFDYEYVMENMTAQMVSISYKVNTKGNKDWKPPQPLYITTDNFGSDYQPEEGEMSNEELDEMLEKWRFRQTD